MTVAEKGSMPTGHETANAIARWHRAAAQTTALLLENEHLLGERMELFRQRSSLLHELVRTATSFVDRAAIHRDAGDAQGTTGTVASPSRRR